MKSWSYILLLLALFISCTPRVEVDNRMTEGYIDMACDATFANVLEQHAYVYTHTYPGAFISMQPDNGRAVLQALLDDSVRLVAMTRRLTDAEKNKILVDNRLNCHETHIAVDAMAMVINRNNPDSVLTVDMVRRILTGEVTRWDELFPGSKLGKIQVIFDNRNSSIVRYAIDSICAPATLYNGVSAVENTMQVVDEVEARRNAIGLIGASWLNAKDSTQVYVKKRLRPVHIKRTADDDAYGPYQAHIASGKYPFFRSIYMINAESNNGLCTGFTIFVAGQRGQKIFEKTNISPARIEERVINIKDKF